MATKLTTTLTQFGGSDASADAHRASGNRLLRRTLVQARIRVGLLVAVALLGIATTVLLPAVLAAVIDAALAGHAITHALLRLAVVLAVATAVSALDDLIGSYLGISVTARLRHRLFGHALALGVPGQRRFPAGDLLSRLAINADSPSNFLPLLLSAGTTSLTAIGGVVGLALIDWRLAATFLLGVPPAVALVHRFIATAGESFSRYQQLLSSVVTRLLDALRGVRTIRASGTADQEIARILGPLRDLRATGREVWMAQGEATWRMSLLAPVIQVLVLSVGGYALTTGDITPGELVASAAYATMALGSVGLLNAFVALLGCQVGAARVAEVLDERPEVSPPSVPVPVPPGPGRLEFNDVTVRVDERVVLDHLDLSVPPGASVAIVGRSGAGKSVLVSLIGRLLDPAEGTVALDGVPVSRMELAALRRTVTYAFDRPALVGATVHDMIAYSRPEVSRAEVEAAAAAAQADRFIRLLPDGYQTLLRHAPMSGGELQRLGLARAIVADARVIVLDDATSSLVTATEVKIVDALGGILARRTSLVVAHRAATAARADLVAWLDRGRIRVLAPHAQLWADPSYRAVFAADWDPEIDWAGSDGVLEAVAET